MKKQNHLTWQRAAIHTVGGVLTAKETPPVQDDAKLLKRMSLSKYKQNTFLPILSW